MQEGLWDFRAKMYWGPGRTRGGEGLLCLTSTPACFRRSVVVEPPDNIYYRGLNTDLNYFGVPCYRYSIIYPQTLFYLLRPLYYQFPVALKHIGVEKCPVTRV